jgi:hypothetical protein
MGSHGMNGTAVKSVRSDITSISGTPPVLRAPDGRPIFLCEYTELGNLRFFCPWCKHMHMHGGGSGGKEPPLLGHRGAHCSRMDSPWMWTGYYLELRDPLPDADAEKRKKMQ